MFTHMNNYNYWAAAIATSPLVLLALLPLEVLLVLELLGLLFQWIPWAVWEWLLCRAVKCARCSSSRFREN